MKSVPNHLVLKTVLVSVVYFLIFGFLGGHGDESFTTTMMERWHNGELIYRDFWSHFTHFGIWLGKVSMDVLGNSIFAVRILMALCFVAYQCFILKTIWSLSQNTVVTFWVSMFAIIWGPVWFVASPHTNVAWVFVAASFALWASCPRPSARDFVLLGGIAAACFFSKQNFAFGPFFVFCLWLRNSDSAFKSTLMCGLGFVTAGALLLIPVYGAIPQMWERAIVDALFAKSGFYFYPFLEKPFKSLVALAGVLLAGFAFRLANSHWQYRILLVAFMGSASLLSYSLFAPDRVLDFLNWYYTIYAHNILGGLLALGFVVALLRPTSPGFQFFLLAGATYLGHMTGGYDINRNTTSSYILYVAMAFLLINHSWPSLRQRRTSALTALMIALSFQLSTGRTNKLVAGIQHGSLFALVTEYAPRMWGQVNETNPSYQCLLRIENTSKPFALIQDLFGAGYYEGLRFTAYWWYLDNQMPKTKTANGFIQEWQDKEILWFNPHPPSTYFGSTLPVAYQYLKEHFQISPTLATQDCPWVYERKKP